jgi:hypothetical protein
MPQHISALLLCHALHDSGNKLHDSHISNGSKVFKGLLKMALLVLPVCRLMRLWQNQMCRLCGWLKLFLKKCDGKK